MVGCRHQKILNIIFLDCLHSLDSLTATVLCAEIVRAHSFDVTKLCHCNNRIGYRDQVFHGNIILVKSDRCSSLIPVFLRNEKNLLPDDTEQLLLVCKDCL